MGKDIYQPTAKDVREITGKFLLTVLQRRITQDKFTMVKTIVHLLIKTGRVLSCIKEAAYRFPLGLPHGPKIIMSCTFP